MTSKVKRKTRPIRKKINSTVLIRMRSRSMTAPLLCGLAPCDQRIATHIRSVTGEPDRSEQIAQCAIKGRETIVLRELRRQPRGLPADVLNPSFTKRYEEKREEPELA